MTMYSATLGASASAATSAACDGPAALGPGGRGRLARLERMSGPRPATSHGAADFHRVLMRGCYVVREPPRCSVAAPALRASCGCGRASQLSALRPVCVVHTCSPSSSARLVSRQRDILDQEGLQHSVEHCGQNRAVGHRVNHVADVLETLRFQELKLLSILTS